MSAPLRPKRTEPDPATPPEAGPLRASGVPGQGGGEHRLRVVETHVADLVARARARLGALVRRLLTPTLRRLAGLMPGAAAPMDPSEAVAFEEAAREAVRATTMLENAMPLGRTPAAGPPLSASAAALPAAPVSPRIVPSPEPLAGTLAAAPEAESPAHTSWAPRPAAPVSARISPVPKPVASPRPKPGAARPVASGPTLTASSPVPVAKPARRRTANAAGEAEPEHDLASPAARGEQPARRPRHQAGETPLDHLLRAPTSVDSAADGFFDALVRRVEGDR